MLTFSFLISHKISTCCPVSRWEARFKNAEGQGDRRNPLSLGQRSSTVLISISDVSVRPHELGALALVPKQIATQIAGNSARTITALDFARADA